MEERADVVIKQLPPRQRWAWEWKHGTPRPLPPGVPEPSPALRYAWLVEAEETIKEAVYGNTRLDELREVGRDFSGLKRATKTKEEMQSS